MSSTEPAVPMEALVDFIWGQYEFLIKTANISVLNIPGHIVDIIGDSGVKSIARSFRFVVLHFLQNSTAPVTNLLIAKSLELPPSVQ